MARTRTSAILVAGVLAALSGCASKPGIAFRELRYPMATRDVQVGTASIAVHDTGKGERTLVLIHGLGSSMPAWKHNIAALAEHYRVVAIDLPGYGKSSKANYAYSMPFFAKAVRGVVRELGLEHVTLVGHSMGGQIAMTYALAHPEDVEALVLTSPAGLETFDEGEARWLAGSLTPEFTCNADAEAIWTRHAANFYKIPKDAEFMVKDRLAVIGGPDFAAYCLAVSRSVSGMIDGPVAARLGDLDMPVLVVFGDADGLIPNPFLHGGNTVKLAKKAVEKLPDGELVILEKGGHMAQFELAEQWNEAVLDFLADAKVPKGERHRRNAPPAVGATIDPLYAPGTDPEQTPPAAAEPEAPTVETPPVPEAPTPEPEVDPMPEPGESPATPADATTTPTPSARRSLR